MLCSSKPLILSDSSCASFCIIHCTHNQVSEFASAMNTNDDAMSKIPFYFYAGLNDLPHSRQHVLERDVISPQNGHTLSGLKSRFSRLNFANQVINQSAMKASFPRKRFRNRRRLGAIDLLEFSPHGHGSSCDRVAATFSEGFHFGTCDTSLG